MSLYTQWPLGLRPNRVLSPRAAMDPVLLGRSDNKDMELAEQISQSVECAPPVFYDRSDRSFVE